MNGMTEVGGVPSWLRQPLSRNQPAHEVEQLAVSKPLGEEMSVRQHQLAPRQSVGVNAEMRIVDS
jgi:hypothetical protein